MTSNNATDGARRFVNVPVPEEFVTRVMAHIGELDVAHRQPTPVMESRDDGEEPVRMSIGDVWPVDQLRDLATGRNFTTKLLTKIMDVLSQEPGEWRNLTELSNLVGEDRRTLKGIWTHVGRHVRVRYPGRLWPLEAKWGPEISPDFEHFVYYRLTEEQSARWKEARGF